MTVVDTGHTVRGEGSRRPQCGAGSRLPTGPARGRACLRRDRGYLADRAAVYTLLYDPTATEGRFESHPVKTSILQRAGLTQASFRKLLPLYPIMAERLPVQEHDVVVSSSSAFAHGVRTSRRGCPPLLLPQPISIRVVRARPSSRGGPAGAPSRARRGVSGHPPLGSQGGDACYALRRELTPHPATHLRAVRP